MTSRSQLAYDQKRFLNRSIVHSFQVITIDRGFDGMGNGCTFCTGVFRWTEKGLGEMIREWEYANRDAAMLGHRTIVDAIRHREDLRRVSVARL